MRVLHINSSLSNNSGVIAVLLNYYQNLDREKIQFDFLYYLPSNFSSEKRIERLGGKTYKISKTNNLLKFRKQISSFFNSYRGQYPIVHLHDPFLARIIYDILKKNGVRYLIVHSHATCYSDKKISSIRNRLLCMNIARHCDVCMACSKAAGDFLFGKKVKYYVMNNAIDLEKFKYNQQIRIEKRHEFGLNNEFVLGHVGNFVNQKNHFFLLKIFSEVLRLKPDAKLLLVGDGILRQRIENKAAEMGIIQKIMFLGKRRDVNEIYQAMDVFALPSLFEGLPMVGVEAQCSGLPIVFSDEISPEAGIGNFMFLKLKDSPGKWASVILQMYEHHKRDKDIALRNLKLHGFDIRTEALKLQNFYFDMIGNK